MIYYYRTTDWWYCNDSRKVFTVEANSIEEAARIAWKSMYPGAEDFPELEETDEKVYFGSVEIPRNQEHMRLNHKFGNSWSTFFRMTDEIDGKRCHCCEEAATQRIEMNVWGSICQYDVCDEHAERYDGRWGDGVPSLEDLTPIKKLKQNAD